MYFLPKSATLKRRGTELKHLDLLEAPPWFLLFLIGGWRFSSPCSWNSLRLTFLFKNTSPCFNKF